MLAFSGAPVRAVELIFYDNSYDVPFVYFITAIFICFAFILKQDIKDIYKCTLDKYEKVTVSLSVCISYIVIPYSIVIFPLVFIRPYLNNQSPINLIVFGISCIIAIVIKETIKKRFSK